MPIAYFGNCEENNPIGIYIFYLLHEKRKLSVLNFFCSHPTQIVCNQTAKKLRLEITKETSVFLLVVNCCQICRLTHNFDDLLWLFILTVISWIYGSLDKGNFINNSRH